MKTITLTIATLGLLTLMSCGQSAEEKAAAEKHKMDSVATATKEQMNAKLALQNSIKTTTANKQMMELQLTNAKGDLAASSPEKVIS